MIASAEVENRATSQPVLEQVLSSLLSKVEVFCLQSRK